MAEIVVAGALKSLCSALATPTLDFINKQWFLVEKVRNEMLDIQRNLESMQSVLKFAERKLETNDDDPMVENWVKQVREVAYEVEDIVDGHMYGLAKRGWLNIKTIRVHMTSRKTDEKLDRIKTSIREILKIHNDLISKKLVTVEERSSSSASTSGLQNFAPTEHWNDDLDDSLFSLDARGQNQQKKLVEEWILQQPSWISAAADDNKIVWFDPRWMCIAVWGMGGLGKTTLIEQIFYHNAALRKEFDCLAWVTVSKNYSFLHLLKELVKKLAEPKEMDTGNKGEEDVIRMIHHIIDEKRYLIVFDDVWQDAFWNQIRTLFRRSDDRRSRVIFTTRDENVAMSVARPDRVMQLSHLNDDQAWYLFCKKAFFGENPPWTCPPQLESCAKEIVRRCGGVPLAIVTVAGMTFTKSTNLLDWERNRSMLSTMMGSKSELNSILIHSYHDLPPHLKQCFLYCCVWPEDWTFEADYIISLWVAEGFIEELNGKTLEETGQLYIEQLVSRSMMIKQVHNDRAYPWYKIHDVLRAMGIGVSQSQKFAAIIDEDHDKDPVDARHLYILGKSMDGIPDQLPMLRTILVREIDELKISLGKFKLLKVLDLGGIWMPRVSRDIFQLYNLRFLNLRETGIEEEVFPWEIERLQNLQVLDIYKTGVKRLPRSIGKLKKLRTLFCGDISSNGVQVPAEIFDLKDLQVLWRVAVNEWGGDVMEQLGNLTQLRELGIVDVKHSHEKQLCSSLKRMPHLKLLEIKTAGDDENPMDLESLEHTHPRNLVHVELCGAIKGIPTWFKSLQSLRYLVLWYSKLEEGGGDILENLKALPCLETLSLVDVFGGTKLSFPSLPCFPRLRILGIGDLKNLTSIEIEDSALPNLRRIEIGKCDELIPSEAADVGKLLDSLEEIVLRYMPPHVVQHFQEMCIESNVKLTVYS